MRARTMADLATGDEGVLKQLDVEEDVEQRLMEQGFVPGASVAAVGKAPGGDPIVYRVDGSDVALREHTARRMLLVVS